MTAHRYFILDREAYEERLAIILPDYEGPPGDTDPYRDANNAAYTTRFSIAATAAANGDWNPARDLCRKERSRFGEQIARELMRDLQHTVREELRLKQM